MDSVRALRDLFADLSGDEGVHAQHAADPETLLGNAGYPDLPDDLVAEAIVSYSHTAPVEVAEHLAPYVMAHSPLPIDDAAGDIGADPANGLDLLSTAPTEFPDASDDALEANGAHAVDVVDLAFGVGEAGEGHSDDGGIDAHHDVSFALPGHGLDASPLAHDVFGHDDVAGIEHGDHLTEPVHEYGPAEHVFDVHEDATNTEDGHVDVDDA